MKKWIWLGITLILVVPFIIAIVDLYWWFWFDHKLSSMDWNAGDGLKAMVAICMASASFIPIMNLNEELKRESVMK